MKDTPNNPSMKTNTTNIREAIKQRIREVDNQPEEISLLEKVGKRFQDKLDAKEITQQVLDNKTGKPQMFINAETLDKHIDMRVKKLVRYYLKEYSSIKSQYSHS